MDVKILGAVFVSLAAVFAGADGGMFSTSDIRDVQSEAGLSVPSTGSLASDIPYVGDFLEKPEPENDVKAQINFAENAELNLKKASLEAQNLTQIKSQSMNINSDSDIKFYDFTGAVKISNNTEITGSSSGLDTSGVNVTTGVQLQTSVDTNKIEVEDTQRVAIKFATASIGPTPDSDFSLDTENTNLDINSFTGDMTIYPKNRTFIIDGKVDRLNAGKYSLEG